MSKSTPPATTQQTPVQPTNSALRVVQGLFLLGAIGAVSGFAFAAQDGESRRSPDKFVKYLAPSYQGDNRIAPNFSLPDRNGTMHSLSEFRGKTVVLHFWTRTCLPCVRELHEGIAGFDQFVRNRNDMVLLLVSADANWNSVEPLMPPDLLATVLFDPKRSVITSQYGTTLFPETWVIDRNGVIRARFDHPIPWESGVWWDYLSQL